MIARPRALARFVLFVLAVAVVRGATAIPLPEHPRPDFERAEWINLNGTWEFRFDKDDAGARAGWAAQRDAEFPERIVVPFPWGSKLSGVENKADIAWYRREVTVPESWRGKRVFLVVGASDWTTEGWLDGHALGEHRGGYTPFEFELTSHVKWGEAQSVVLRVDDTPHPFKLEGKQGYGQAKGIWQTIYLEARPAVHVRSLRFTPDLDAGKVSVLARLSDAAPAGGKLALQFKTGGVPDVIHEIPAGSNEVTCDVPIADVRPWSLEDPFLYEVEVAVNAADGASDRVASYFGMRKISVEKLPGTNIPYVALNGRPVYLQMALDQSYHPDGYYTFPTDEFMRDEIVRSKQIGLNGNRVHIKVEVPRKLYWADRLGLLIMADVPNFWGEPTPEARAESEFALRGMIERDFNHPSIFSWVVFNETWGLFTGEGENKKYLPETQEWVISMYRLAKQLDPTRLVEDNSPCNNDHTETDLNTWHEYRPGYTWREGMEHISRNTFPGSTWNFIGGRTQGEQPMFNSECGNVWGYEGSAGDVDWTWDYHIMLNVFRRHPKLSGWLYTEHHDVINEWNGYFRYDRSEKFTGLDAFVPQMSLNDLHAPFYISTGDEICRDVTPGQVVEVPLFASFLTDRAPGSRLVLRAQLYGWNNLGQREEYSVSTETIPFEPWMSRELKPLRVMMPKKPALAVLALTLESEAGAVLHRNFTTFLVADGPSPRWEMRNVSGRHQRLVRFAPSTFSAAQWSQKQWNVLDGLKVNGAGSGFFEYRLPWPEHLDAKKVTGATLVFEASAKQLFGKDRDGAINIPADTDFMRGSGPHDPSANPNAYPMTDTTKFPTAVRVRVNGFAADVVSLPDDPADHRGVLSWHAQPRDRKLREAGSYGYLAEVTLPPAALEKAAAAGEIVLRFEVDDALPGGLALYGERFGRYPVDPTLVFHLR